MIPRFVVACLKGESPRVHGDGEQTRDFTFIDDAVQANLLAADAERVSGAVMNVATGRETSIRQLLQGVIELTRADVEAAHVHPFSGECDRRGAALAVRNAGDKSRLSSKTHARL